MRQRANHFSKKEKVLGQFLIPEKVKKVAKIELMDALIRQSLPTSLGK